MEISQTKKRDCNVFNIVVRDENAMTISKNILHAKIRFTLWDKITDNRTNTTQIRGIAKI